MLALFPISLLIYLPVVLSNPSFASSIGHSLSSPFHLHLLSRRQAGTTPSLGAIDGLTTLLTQALQGQQTGECAEECQSWTEAVQICIQEPTAEATGRCACEGDLVEQAAPCGECFESSGGVEAVEGYEDLCSAVSSGATPTDGSDDTVTDETSSTARLDSPTSTDDSTSPTETSAFGGEDDDEDDEEEEGEGSTDTNTTDSFPAPTLAAPPSRNGPSETGTDGTQSTPSPTLFSGGPDVNNEDQAGGSQQRVPPGRGAAGASAWTTSMSAGSLVVLTFLAGVMIV